MKKISSPQKQLNYFFKFDSTTEGTIFLTDCTKNAKNPIFFYRHRQGTLIDIFNPWRRMEEITNYFRTDIARSYRLGDGF